MWSPSWHDHARGVRWDSCSPLQEQTFNAYLRMFAITVVSGGSLWRRGTANQLVVKVHTHMSFGCWARRSLPLLFIFWTSRSTNLLLRAKKTSQTLIQKGVSMQPILSSCPLRLNCSRAGECNHATKSLAQHPCPWIIYHVPARPEAVRVTTVPSQAKMANFDDAFTGSQQISVKKKYLHTTFKVLVCSSKCSSTTYQNLRKHVRSP